MPTFDPVVLSLASVLDINAAAPLAAELLALRGLPVTLDASSTERLGGLCLQVPLAARSAWALDGAPFEIAGRSDAFDEALELFGAPHLGVPAAPALEAAS